MELKLEEKDYQAAERGGLETVSGAAALLQRVLLKLSARRGSFPFLPRLGSRLYLLGREPFDQRQGMAEAFVKEALADESGLSVTGVTLSELEQGRMAVRVELEWQGTALELTLETVG
jgi:hypothetical protein